MTFSRRFRPCRICWILALATALVGEYGMAAAQGTAEPARVALAAWDTGTSSTEPLTPQALEQKVDPWTPPVHRPAGSTLV